MNKDMIADSLGMKSLTRAAVDKVKEKVIDAEFTVLDPRNGDYELGRANIKKVIEMGMDATRELAAISDMSQDPESYEALSSLMKTMLKANRDLLEMERINDGINLHRIQNVRNENKKLGGDVHNHLYVGSTKELQDIIMRMTKKHGAD